jgi:hypothetical protein
MYYYYKMLALVLGILPTFYLVDSLGAQLNCMFSLEIGIRIPFILCEVEQNTKPEMVLTCLHSF